MGHPDFRVRGKIFATLGWPDKTWGMVKLTPDEQTLFVERHPNVFAPIPGGWGRSGSTQVNIKLASVTLVRRALAAAWYDRAPAAARKVQQGAAQSRRKRKTND
jgi:YjbR